MQLHYQIQIRINRNIVECKEFYADGIAYYVTVLIETLWNVKHHIRKVC